MLTCALLDIKLELSLELETPARELDVYTEKLFDQISPTSAEVATPALPHVSSQLSVLLTITKKMECVIGDL